MTPGVQEIRRIAEQRLEISLSLHDYQWEGISFLFASSQALLADEMGLGKTVQTVIAITLLLEEQNEINRVLIVAPASLTLNWMAELSTWSPAVTVWRVQGGNTDRKAFYMLPIPVLVASYEQIREDAFEEIPIGTFDLIVLDEAQRIKNRNSETAFACRLLSKKRAWALSATPLENNRDDIISLLGFLDPKFDRWASYAKMSEKLKEVMLRRKKQDVRAELPPVIVQDLRLSLSPRQREEYEALWGARETHISKGGSDIHDNRDSVAMLGLLTRLKVLCNFDAVSGESTKFEALETICEGAGGSARIIVFSQFVETLCWVSERLHIPHDLLTGSMTQEQRQLAIHRFRTEPSPYVLLISLRAGGVGLNLGEASHVILFDRWWNPAVEIQAMYRAHRFDRNEPLHVVRFLVDDSIEERIAKILEGKEHLFSEIVDPITSDTKLTRRDMIKILNLNARR